MRTLKQLFCTHKTRLTRRDGARMFTECRECGHQSEGIETGGFKYHEDVYLRIERSKSAVAGL